MATLRQSVFRILNGVRKLSAGLKPFSESVWPGVRNDLFVAHESIYRFAERYAAGADVLDAGCGTGYGSSLLRASANSVLGIDLDPSNIRYARRHYGSSARFEVGDIENLTLPPQSIDLVVASNSLEHLHSPARFLHGIRNTLRPEGRAVLAVPPIYSESDLDVHAGIHYHRSNLTIQEWIGLIEEAGFDLQCVQHRTRDDVLPDFSSHLASTLDPESFLFEPVARETMLREPTITTIFVAEPVRAER